MAEVIDVTTNIVIGGYIVLDEEGRQVEVVEHDETKKSLNSRFDVDDYIFQIEEHKEAETEDHNLTDLNINYKEGPYYEVVKFEDGILDSTFEAIEKHSLVKEERKTETTLCNEDSIDKFLPFRKEQLVEDCGNSSFQFLCSKVEQIHDVSEGGEEVYMNEGVVGESIYIDKYLDEKLDLEMNQKYLSKDENVSMENLTRYTSSTQESFPEYATDLNSDEKLFCKKCQAFFSDLHSIEEHVCHSITRSKGSKVMQYVNNYDCYTCNFCQSRLKTFRGLQRHKLNCRMKAPSFQTQHDELKCPTCLKLFPTVKSLCTHKRLHGTPVSKNSSKEIVCAICNTVFTSLKNLKLHRKIHDKKPIKSILEALPAGAEVEYNELNQFFCEICNKSFDQNLLAVHKNMHQNVEEYNCSICNRQFENMPSYEMHVQLHTDKPRRVQTKTERTGTKLPFPCNYCGREFARPHEKVKHERIHTGEKPYECEVCGKTFRVSYSLTLHLRTHTDIRPYVCATCNKRFKSQPVYAHHLNTHLTERPYKCNTCSKTFRTSVQLCGHKNSHTKPFSCIECNRPFATLYSVKVHMKTHSKTNKCNEILKHRCKICGAVYARIFALRFHMKEHHSIEFGNSNQALQLENDVDANVAENTLRLMHD